MCVCSPSTVFLALLLLFSTLFGFCVCETQGTNRLECVDGVCTRPLLSTLKFLLLGDSGGLPVYPYTTYAQNRVAEAMAKLGDETHTEFQISVGDNIYYTGVMDPNDSRFETSFENVYNGEALSKPWYFIAGNHDHFGNISAQVAYTANSSRWTFPSLYYKVSYTFGEQKTRVEFVMIDTIVLCGNTRDIEAAGFVDMLFADVSKDPNNPKDPQAAKKQLQWIEQQLKNSTANYLFVVGHYPVYSVSSHGPSTCLIQKLLPLLTKYRVSAYFAGHDHTLQHLVVRSSNDSLDANQTEPTTIHYVVSGASSRTDRSQKHTDDVPFGSLRFNYPTGFNPFSQLGFTNGGFVHVELKEDSGTFKFCNGKGEQVYDCTVDPRL